MNRYEKQKLAVEKAMSEKVDAYQAIYKKADDEDRDPTDEERLEVEWHLKAIETLKVERAEAEENIKTLQQRRGHRPRARAGRLSVRHATSSATVSRRTVRFRPPEDAR